MEENIDKVLDNFKGSLKNAGNTVAISIMNPSMYLGVAFVVLKLCKVIDWSWWLVTLPFWWAIALVTTILVIALIVCFIAALFK